MTNNTYNSPVKTILEDHSKYFNIYTDIISHSLTDTQWLRVKSLLSPEYKYVIPDALNFYSVIMSQVKCIPTKVLWFHKRETIIFHVSYEFPSWEGAACFEFLMRGPRKIPEQVIDLPEVTHSIHVPSLSGGEISHIYGVVTVEKSKTADTYNRLINMPWFKKLLVDRRNYYILINKSLLMEIL